MRSPSFFFYREVYTSYYENHYITEVIIMNVEKIIRVLGYIVYTALWLPIIVLAIVSAPIVVLAVDLRLGQSIKGSINSLKDIFVDAVRHDVEFIRTGKW